MTRMWILAMLGVMLIHATGCMNYASWQNDRRNQRAQVSYNSAVSRRLADHVPIGTWYYELRSYSKTGWPTKVWLTLGGDGAFDRIRQDGGLFRFECWKHDSGVWENASNISVRLKFSDDANRTEVVDLTTKANLFVEFDREVKEGIQPAPARYRP